MFENVPITGIKTYFSWYFYGMNIINKHRVITKYKQITWRNRYNITSSSTLGYCWFRIAKNGTRSLLSALEALEKPDIHGSWIKYKANRFEHLLKFTVIRNPWDRLVSCYADKVVEKKTFTACIGKDFEFFVDYIGKQNLHRCNRHFRLQSSLFPVATTDLILRFEHFTDDLQLLEQKLGITLPIGHLHKSKHTAYRAYYTDSLKRKVELLYADDILLGDYRF